MLSDKNFVIFLFVVVVSVFLWCRCCSVLLFLHLSFRLFRILFLNINNLKRQQYPDVYAPNTRFGAYEIEWNEKRMSHFFFACASVCLCAVFEFFDLVYASLVSLCVSLLSSKWWWLFFTVIAVAVVVGACWNSKKSLFR